MKGNYDTKYCDRIASGETQNCQTLAAQENYRKKVADDAALPIYHKYYKRYAARVWRKRLKPFCPSGQDRLKYLQPQLIFLHRPCDLQGQLS